MFTLKAEKRDLKTKLDVLRKSGKMPAVFYGVGQETTAVAVPLIEFKKVWREAGESSAVKVSLPTGDIDVLIHEVQVDSVTDEPRHADFLVIDMTKKIQVSVPLIFEGISDAVKNGLGNLVKVLHEIEIEALPADLPHDLVVDISKLKTLDDTVTVADIKLPTGVMIITDGQDVVASIVEQVEEKEEVVAPVDLSEIEVEQKGKKDLAEEAGEEGKADTVASAKEPAPADKKSEKK